jgi:hypothetical protein
MAFSANTAGFPQGIASYSEALEHFESTTPWRSKYNDANERPIGQRAVKHNDGRQFNKAMRRIDDNIHFRLFDTDCVIWHPDNTVTVQGYPSMSTTDFIRHLSPAGVEHSYRTITYDGRVSHREDPVLHLAPMTTKQYASDPRYPDVTSSYVVPDRDRGEVIRCDRPVRLHYSAGRWRPVDPDRLEPFYVPRVDRKAARAVSKQYNLSTLQQIINAIMALHAPPPPPATWAPGSVRFGEIMDALEQEDYMGAISLFPRGTSRGFGRHYGTPEGIQPGFLRKLRDHIYDHEGVIDRSEERSLGPSAYKRYVADVNRFDA